ncbi:MAG: amino acid permease [Acidimicrobiia bacterium]|nr:amino acid permease [Acidimicrobiia bacterium]MBT8217850.1 amino acid permease [Acidimicrobiia bacterium]NNL69309.1 amino acid permease [Acidimicrobiia bacterium]
MTNGLPDGEKQRTLGTFSGVFMPSILTILGIILFLRLGYVVGNAGLSGSLVIIGIATGVSVLTSISLSAIATNIDVGPGGDYYMISRTLGVEFGGAIGLVLFLAQAVSIAFYAIGFGEATAAVAGFEGELPAQVIAAAATVALFGLAWMGADVASKFQAVVMVLLVAALASFYLGAIPGFNSGVAGDNLSAPAGGLAFWTIFAIFFPAVTGFTQGVSLSGDLKDPGKSLPTGTFAAVGVSTVVYISIAILFAGNATSRFLIEDNGAMGSISAFGPLIDAGVIAATLSSAMASFLGAPRILQSLAADKVFPGLGFFAKGSGPTNNPRRGVLLSLAIAIATIGLGSLDAIAPLVSMFFLISYGLLNYATYYETRAKSPSFRPRFRFFNKRLSLLGSLACLGVMLAINPFAGAAAVLVIYGIYQYVGGRGRPERWADSARAHHFQRAKESIDAMRDELVHARNWRPQILAFSADPKRRHRLLEFGSWLEGGSGLTAAVQIVVGEGAVKRREVAEAQKQLDAQIAQLGLSVHGRAVLAPDPGEALPVIIQAFGLGPIHANTVLFGWPEDPAQERMDSFFAVVRDVIRLSVNTVILSSGDRSWSRLEAVPAKKRRIDVWYRDDDDASELALLSAYLFTRTDPWGGASIRVIGQAGDADPTEVTAELQDHLKTVRIPAEVVVLPTIDTSVVLNESAESTAVFLPMTLRRKNYEGPFGCDLDTLVAQLPFTVSLLAGQTIDLAAAPESGSPALLMAAEEQVAAAAKRLSTLETDLESARTELNRAETKAIETLEQADQARRDELAEKVEDLNRRVLSASARLERAKGELEAITAENGTP